MKLVSYIFLTILTNFILTLEVYSEEIFAETSIEPDHIAVGETVSYYLTIHGTHKTPEAAIPQFPGIKIEYTGGARQSTQVINGKISIQSVYPFIITASKAGQYVIPEYTLTIDGESLTVPSASLTVSEKDSLPSNSPKNNIWFELSFLEHGKIFNGQMLPVKLELYVPSGVTGQLVSQFPIKEGDSFAEHGFSQPNRQIVSVDNVQYQKLIWFTYITPLKTGLQSIEYEMELVITKPKSQRRPTAQNVLRHNLGSLLDDLFMEEHHRIPVTTGQFDVEVKPLPIHGKPDSYSGAIGSFKVANTKVDNNSINLGEPVVLTLEVEGKGNFSQISPPPLELPEDSWKTYSPKSEFYPDDQFGYSGKKVFEYIIIPQNETISSIPSLHFDVFDPDTEQYDELITEPISINVKPAQVANKPHSQNDSQLLKHQKDEVVKASGLLPIKLRMGKTVQSIVPKIKQRGFIAGQSIPFLIIMTLFLIKRRKNKLYANLEYVKQLKTEKAILKYLGKIKKAYDKQNAKAFYDATRLAISEIIARFHHTSADALTLSEIIDFLREKKLSQDSIKSVQSIFEEADSLKFGGKNEKYSLPDNLLETTRSTIDKLLNDL